MPATEPLLKVKDVAGRLNVHDSSVRNWVLSGQVRAVKTPGGNYRIPASELDRLLAGEPTKGELA